MWTMPTTTVPVPLPLLYPKGASTSIEGGCLIVYSAPNHPVAVWGAGAWERADISD